MILTPLLPMLLLLCVLFALEVWGLDLEYLVKESKVGPTLGFGVFFMTIPIKPIF